MEARDEALGVTLGRTASSADLGGKFLPALISKIKTFYRLLTFLSLIGSSKYSNENFED